MRLLSDWFAHVRRPPGSGRHPPVQQNSRQRPASTSAAADNRLAEYSLRERPHQFQLPERSDRLPGSNFVNRML